VGACVCIVAHGTEAMDTNLHTHTHTHTHTHMHTHMRAHTCTPPHLRDILIAVDGHHRPVRLLALVAHPQGSAQEAGPARGCGVQVWGAGAGCRCGVQVWGAGVGCRSGVQVWGAGVGCMWGAGAGTMSERRHRLCPLSEGPQRCVH